MDNYQITADLKRVQGDDCYTIALPLPAKTLKSILNYKGYKCTKEFTLSDVICRGDDTFTHTLNEIFDITETPKKLEELNYLAFKIFEMSEEERDKFGAVLSTKQHHNSIGELINLTENLDCFELQPAYNENQYGDFLMSFEQDNTHEAFNRLVNSENPQDNQLAEYIERLEEAVDKDYYGSRAAKRECGDFTKFGYLTTSADVQTKYHVIGDIPLEYRLTKPKLAEILKAGKEKSREQFGSASLATNIGKGETII